jgi:asparaginyl-tRNA synthetase
MLLAIMRLCTVVCSTCYFKKGLCYIITGSDEGAGEMFKVTALPFDNTHTEEESKL